MTNRRTVETSHTQPDADFGRRALVTGAGRRIGMAIASSLAEDGWAVALHYNQSGPTAEKLAKNIIDQDGRAVAVRANLASEEEARDLLPRAAQILANAENGPTEQTDNGGVPHFDLLINSAAAFLPEGNDAPLDIWQTHMDVNLRAPYLLSWAFARQYDGAANDRTGLIINILDRSVINPPADFASYTASKAALWALTQTLAASMAPSIRVNAVGPGPTLRHQRQSESHFAEQARATPLGRHTDPNEIASAVRFLITTPSLTGQIILLDNGHHLL